jgi:hypothetical protein
MITLKILCLIFLLIYILLIIHIYKNKFNNIEKFTMFLETISNLVDNKSYNNTNNNNINNYIIKEKKEEKKDIQIKYIYLSNELSDKINDNKYIKYYLYDKNNDFYMKIVGKLYDYDKKIEFKDIKDNIIGNLISEKYTILKFKMDFYKDNIINIEYTNNYQSVKIYLEHDDKIFYIISKNNKYYIYLFNNLEIGFIKKDTDKNIYKIIVYEEYKTYLNLIALGLVSLLNS